MQYKVHIKKALAGEIPLLLDNITTVMIFDTVPHSL